MDATAKENMAYIEDKFTKQLAIAKLKVKPILQLSAREHPEDVSLAYEQIGELIKRLERSKQATGDYLMETD